MGVVWVGVVGSSVLLAVGCGMRMGPRRRGGDKCANPLKEKKKGGVEGSSGGVGASDRGAVGVGGREVAISEWYLRSAVAAGGGRSSFPCPPNQPRGRSAIAGVEAKRRSGRGIGRGGATSSEEKYVRGVKHDNGRGGGGVLVVFVCLESALRPASTADWNRS